MAKVEELESPQKKFLEARTLMNSSLVEREDEIDIMLTAVIDAEHPLLVGEPGTAKTLLGDILSSWLQAPKFDYLLTKFTDPMELFGPIDITELKAGRTKRIVGGMLPEAVVVFLDEIFKASSAILNTTLKFLNERKFKYGTQEIKCPLKICIAASNEWPNDDNGGKELGALFDRFLFRKTVRPISKSGRRKLLKKAVDLDDCKPLFPNSITPQELDLAHREAMSIPWGVEAKRALWQILSDLGKDCPGDRRIYKSVGAVRSYCYLEQEKEVQPQHLTILQHVLWSDPTEQPENCAKIVNSIANPEANKIVGLQLEAEDVLEKAKSSSEAVVKLEAIKKSLKALSPSPKRDRVLGIVQEYVKEKHFEVIGANNKEEGESHA